MLAPWSGGYRTIWLGLSGIGVACGEPDCGGRIQALNWVHTM